MPDRESGNDTASTAQAGLGTSGEFDAFGAKIDTPTDTAEFNDREEVTWVVTGWLLHLDGDLLQTSRQKPCDYPLGWPEGPNFGCRD